MNRLLELQRRVQDVKRPVTGPIHNESVDTYKNAINQPRFSMRYLPIIGKVTRRESGAGIPLLPVEFEGVFSADGKRIDTDQMIFESKTNGKGNFFMLISYFPQVEEKIKDGTVYINVAGQSSIFKMDVLSYAGRGKAELKSFIPNDSIEHLFIRLGMQSEKQLTSRNQLTCIAIDEMSIA